MKQLLLLFVWLTITLGVQAQGLIQVSPVAGYGDYTDLQLAIDAAVAGDTIYVYPGSYGDIAIDKGVYVYGPGWDLPQNPITGVTTITANSIVGDVFLSAGADGAKVKGLRITGYMTVNDVSNVEIVGNRTSLQIAVANSSGILIQGNYVHYQTNSFYYVALSGSQSVMVRNNVLGYISMNATSGALIKNNIIIHGGNVFHNSEIKNNIFYYSTGNPISANSANDIQYNVFCASVSYANNLAGQPQNSLFLQTSTINNSTIDANLQLSPTSPAIGAGENGEDCGIFGGSIPYKFSGIPELPLIYELNVPENAAGSLDVNIKVRGEN